MGTEPQMTVSTLKVLRALVDDADGHHYGLEVAQAAGLARGSVYPILIRLEQAGWLESDWEAIDPEVEGRPRRRYYTLSIKGAQRARHALYETRRALEPVKPMWVPRAGDAPP